MKYTFLVETYATERVKLLSVWGEFHEQDLPIRPRQGDPRGRSVHEQMVHQCMSEDLWFRAMLGIDVNAPPLPKQETRLEFIKQYAEDSGKRLSIVAREGRSLVGRNRKILRRLTFPDLDHDPALAPHFPSPWTVDGYAAHAGALHP